MTIRYSVNQLMKEQRPKQRGWKGRRRDETSQELLFACFSFVLLLVAALADATLKL